MMNMGAIFPSSVEACRDGDTEGRRHAYGAGDRIGDVRDVQHVESIQHVVPPELRAPNAICTLDARSYIEQSVGGDFGLHPISEGGVRIAAVRLACANEQAELAGDGKVKFPVAHELPLGCIRKRLAFQVDGDTEWIRCDDIAIDP